MCYRKPALLLMHSGCRYTGLYKLSSFCFNLNNSCLTSTGEFSIPCKLTRRIVLIFHMTTNSRTIGLISRHSQAEFHHALSVQNIKFKTNTKLVMIELSAYFLRVCRAVNSLVVWWGIAACGSDNSFTLLTALSLPSEHAFPSSAATNTWKYFVSLTLFLLCSLPTEEIAAPCQWGPFSPKAISWVHFWTTGDQGRVVNLAPSLVFFFSPQWEKVTNTK